MLGLKASSGLLTELAHQLVEAKAAVGRFTAVKELDIVLVNLSMKGVRRSRLSWPFCHRLVSACPQCP